MLGEQGLNEREHRDHGEPNGEIQSWAFWGLAAILVGTLAVRCVRLDQPIVENYVGRQVPTAMVAANLDRGSGFFHPQLDTAPFPNYFIVEPPIYQSIVVLVHQLSGVDLSACGRLVSALATVLAAWGLYGLTRRRDGVAIALVSTAAFALLPITLRYGRAFQPDLLMLAGLLAGLNCWDRGERTASWRWRLAGWGLLAIGLAAKVTGAFVFLPLILAVSVRRRAVSSIAAVTAIAPALLWYLWANHLADSGEGSRASADNRAIWLSVLGVSSLASLHTLQEIWRFLIVRAFTPLGPPLAIWGLFGRNRSDSSGWDLWKVWGVGALGTSLMLAQKLHHEYYWLGLSPVIAVGLGRAGCRLWSWNRPAALGLGVVFLIACGVCSRSTWVTPREWNDLEAAARLVREQVPRDALLVAVEPLLYESNRRGCRLEFSPTACARAAQEWGDAGGAAVDGPLELIRFYNGKGARYVADLTADAGDLRKAALHQAIRERYKVLIDDATVMIVDLESPKETRYAE